MAYQKQEWIDRVIDPAQIDPETGKPKVVQEGTRFTSTRANHFEQGIADAHNLVESLAKELGGNFVAAPGGIAGLQFSTSGLNASWTTGIAYVNGRRFDVPAGSMALNATQGQWLYLDVDGTVKKTTSQATAEAGLLLWYFATDASQVITSEDRRNILNLDAMTVDQTITLPTSAPTGRIRQWLSWFANMITKVTGKPNWWDAPRTTLQNAVKLNGDTMTGALKMQYGGDTTNIVLSRNVGDNYQLRTNDDGTGSGGGVGAQLDATKPSWALALYEGNKDRFSIYRKAPGESTWGTPLLSVSNAGILKTKSYLNGITEDKTPPIEVNLLPNSSAEFGMYLWEDWAGGRIIPAAGGNGEGSYWSHGTNAGGSDHIRSVLIPVPSNAPVTLSVEAHTTGITSGGAAMEIVGYDSNKVAIGTIAAYNFPNGQGWTRYFVSGTTQANCRYVQVRLVLKAGTINNKTAWRRAKLEYGLSTPTPYSTEADFNIMNYPGVVWNDSIASKNARSFFVGKLSADQTFPNNFVMTKINIDTVIVDQRTEWQAGTKQFKVAQTGLYLIQGMLTFTSTTQNSRVGASAYKNGIREQNIGSAHFSNSTGADGGVALSGIVACAAGDLIDFYMQASGTCTLSKDFSYINIIRIA